MNVSGRALSTTFSTAVVEPRRLAKVALDKVAYVAAVLLQDGLVQAELGAEFFELFGGEGRGRSRTGS